MQETRICKNCGGTLLVVKPLGRPYRPVITYKHVWWNLGGCKNPEPIEISATGVSFEVN